MKVYCNEAKERVARQGITAITDFINAVPASVRAKCLARLPPIPGFRKGSQLELKEQHKKLVHTLSHVSDVRFRNDGAEWTALGSIWVRHAMKSFGDDNVLSKLPSDATDESATFEYFNGLIIGRGNEGCSRDEIEPLYKFSGFPSSERVEALIASLPPKDILERQRKIASLPKDVEQVRARVERIESESLEVAKALDALKASVGERSENLILQRVTIRLDAQRRAYESQLEEASRHAEAVANELLAKLHPIEQAATNNKAEIGKLNKVCTELAATVHSLKHTITGVEASFAELDLSITAKLQETRPRRRAADELAVEEIKFSPSLILSGSRSRSGKTKSINNPKEAIGFISANFVCIGVQAAEANELASVVLAAALDGQLIQFKGSLANVLAHTTCSTLAGGAYATWDVPMGLCNGNEMRSVIAQMKSDETNEKCLLLRGINKSAFEIYGDDMREVVVSSLIGLAPKSVKMFNVATWAEGPAALPGGTLLASLGPVINTDNLHWGRPKPDRQLDAILDIEGITAKLKGEADAEEVADLTRELIQTFEPCNQLRRRALAVTAANLLSLNNGNDTLSYRQAVTYWGLPWAAAIGMPQEGVAAAIRKMLPEALTIPTVTKGLDELVSEPAY
jgi:hypothetical protein